MTAPARFTKADLVRAFKAAEEADVRVRIEIEPSGKMVILTESGAASAAANSNSWDKVLPR